MSTLSRELKKRNPFVSSEQELLLSLARTSDRLRIHLDRFLAEYGLTGSQYNVLRILRGEGKPLPIQEVASRTVQVVPGMTGLIDRLELAGLVQRERSAEDRRVIFVSATPTALDLLKQIDEPLIAREKQLLQPLTADEQHQLIALLSKIRGSLPEEESERPAAKKRPARAAAARSQPSKTRE